MPPNGTACTSGRCNSTLGLNPPFHIIFHINGTDSVEPCFTSQAASSARRCKPYVSCHKPAMLYGRCASKLSRGLGTAAEDNRLQLQMKTSRQEVHVV